jgi:hypothetical protein
VTTPNELQSLKQRLSPVLLGIPGVSGIGITKGQLAIYLVEDSAQVRRDVAAVLQREAPGAAADYVVTGRFKRQ